MGYIASKAFEKHGAELGFYGDDGMMAMAEAIDDIMATGPGILRDDGARIWFDQGRMLVVGASRADVGTFMVPDDLAKEMAKVAAREA